MPTVDRASGLHIVIPERLRVVEEAAGAGGRRRRGPAAEATEAARREKDAILSAMQSQDMTLVDAVALEPSPVARRARGGPKPPTSPQTEAAEFEVEFAPHEDGALLLEQGGMYSWHYASKSADIPGRRARGASGATQAKRRITFSIPTASLAGPASRRAARGPIEDFVSGRIQASLFKFGARVAAGLVVKIVERNVARGIIRIGSSDLKEWKAVDDLGDLPLPGDRPARILLFIHGTTSNVIANFGPLTGTPWGKKFIDGALSTYDAVLGFNHATLSEDPLANATDLLGILRKRHWPQPPRIDVVAHSRGGLVYRSMVEQLLPVSGWQAHFDRAVFVACTNGGTQFASPQNWETLVDLYTNLAVSTCRVLGMIPQAKGTTLILGEALKALAGFVKCCASRVLTEKGVPGLAAMQPDGDFIKAINQTQPGQPTPEKSNYYAVVSNFELDRVNGAGPKEFSSRLSLWLRDAVMDRLMKGVPNDLIVDTPSMTHIDPETGNFIRASLDFGTNPHVYHTNYFVQPETARALCRWLQIVEPVARATRRASDIRHRAAGRARVTRRGGSSRGTAASRSTRGGGRGGSVRGGGPKEPARPKALGVEYSPVESGNVPATASTNIVVTSSKATAAEVKALISGNAPSHVVISRDLPGENLLYAFPSQEILSQVRGVRASQTIETTLELLEPMASRTIPAGRSFEFVASPYPSASRGVVIDEGRAVGVFDESTPVISSADMADLATRVSRPRNIDDRIMAARAMPRPATPRATPSTRTITCNFLAEMPEEVVMGEKTNLDVYVSRETIAKATRAATAAGRADGVDPTRRMIVQVLAKRNFDAGSFEDSRVEIEPPEGGRPRHLCFEVIGLGVGEGELLVSIRQGPVVLADLVLKPMVIEAARGHAGRIVVETAAPEAAPMQEQLNQLFIEEQNRTGSVVYRYELRSPSLDIAELYESAPVVGNRQEYVDNLYKEIEERWLSNKDDSESFAAELRAFGGQLFDQLFPVGLRKLLWENRERLSSIMVFSTEPFIPWELVHLKDPNDTALPAETMFLGQKGLVRWLHGAGWPPDKIRIRNSKVEYVIPKYPDPDYVLPQARKEGRFLEEKFVAADLEPQPAAVTKALSMPGRFDLLHFACHGSAESVNISNAKLILQGRVEQGKYIPAYLSSTVVEQFSRLRAPDNNRPMVVVNACQTGRTGYALTGLGGFAQAFLRRGAGAFVGTLWSIGDSPARTFTEALYKQLSGGSRLSEAVVTAREAARRAGDATWLAYAVYGHPHLRVVRR